MTIAARRAALWRAGGAPDPVLSLDAGNPASYPGSGANWFDLSGNGNNAVLDFPPQIPFSTNAGGSLVFGQFRRATFPTYAQPAYGTGTSFTWEVWFNTTDASNTDSALLGLRGSDLEFTRLSRARFDYHPASINTGAVNNTWTMVTAIKDGTNLRCFRNGAVVGSTTSTAVKGPRPFFVNNESGSSPVTSITTVNVWNVALTNGQILARFEASRSRHGI